MSFDFENLDVYRKSIHFVKKLKTFLAARKGKISYSTLDQINRASLSISSNIAEGCGRWHVNEKKKFYWISRGSAFEVVSILNVIQLDFEDSVGHIQALKADLRDISMMVTKLAKSMDRLNR